MMVVPEMHKLERTVAKEASLLLLREPDTLSMTVTNDTPVPHREAPQLPL
jgi:hypothetical protein